MQGSDLSNSLFSLCCQLCTPIALTQPSCVSAQIRSPPPLCARCGLTCGYFCTVWYCIFYNLIWILNFLLHFVNFRVCPNFFPLVYFALLLFRSNKIVRRLTEGKNGIFFFATKSVQNYKTKSLSDQNPPLKYKSPRLGFLKFRTKYKKKPVSRFLHISPQGETPLPPPPNSYALLISCCGSLLRHFPRPNGFRQNDGIIKMQNFRVNAHDTATPMPHAGMFAPTHSQNSTQSHGPGTGGPEPLIPIIAYGGVRPLSYLKHGPYHSRTSVWTECWNQNLYVGVGWAGGGLQNTGV